MLLEKLSPLRAIRDLRGFLADRKPYELYFLMAAFAVTFAIVWAFVRDTKFEKPYERNIIYVQSWPLDRSDEAIKAQQKIDQEKKKILQAELDKRKAENMRQFKKLDKKLDDLGL